MAEPRPTILVSRHNEPVRALFEGTVLPPAAHAGLVYERYAHLWRVDSEGAAPVRSEEVRPYLDKFVEGYNREDRDRRQQLGRRAARIKRLAMDRGSYWDFTTLDRFAIGLGADHPSENGFTFDRAVGVPVLPGSSVRGLVRATGNAIGHESEVVRLLGPAPGDAELEPASGKVSFLDAWPIHWPKLEVDVVNPHHPEFYRLLHKFQPPAADPERVPRATLLEDPIPAFFLTVAAEVTFRFGIRWRDWPLGNEDDSRLVRTWLEAGLAFLGAGAKTAAGYGRFEPRKGQQ